jgi:hypothetical protein
VEAAAALLSSLVFPVDTVHTQGCGQGRSGPCPARRTGKEIVQAQSTGDGKIAMADSGVNKIALVEVLNGAVTPRPEIRGRSRTIGSDLTRLSLGQRGREGSLEDYRLSGRVKSSANEAQLAPPADAN